jgi:hypothetical protein
VPHRVCYLRDTGLLSGLVPLAMALMLEVEEEEEEWLAQEYLGDGEENGRFM